MGKETIDPFYTGPTHYDSVENDDVWEIPEDMWQRAQASRDPEALEEFIRKESMPTLEQRREKIRMT